MAKYYTVYEEKTDKIVVSGTAEHCAEFLKIKVKSFYYAVSRQKRTARKSKYVIVVDDDLGAN